MKSDKVLLKSILFYIMTFIITIAIGISQQVFKINELLSLPQLAPGLAAILLIIIFERKNFLNFFKDKFSFNFKKYYPYFIISILPIIIIPFSYIIYKYIFNIENSKNDIYLIILIWPIIGALFEELGWRGYFLEVIGKKLNVFISSLIVGLFWFLWHVNLLKNGFAFSLVAFTQILSFSFILSFAFYRTSKSILVVYLFHFFANIFSYIFILKYFNDIKFMSIMTIPYLLVAIILIIVNKKFYFSKNE